MAKGYNRGPKRGAAGGMMAQLQAMQAQMEQVQAQLALDTVSSSVGGGMVKVVMTGDQKCQSVEINPEILEDADAEMLQDLILSAVNQALDKSRELQAEKMGPLTGGLGGFGL
jgi:DNA-binding YbaB/EbfC family protein